MSDNTLEKELTPKDSETETPEKVPATESTTSNDAYYESQIKELEAARDKARVEKENLLKALQEERSKKRERMQDEEDGSSAPLDDERIAKLVSETADRKFNEMQVDLAMSIFKEEIDKISSNEKEKELINMHYKSSIKPSGFDRAAIRKDLALSKAAANIDRVKFSSNNTDDASLATALGGGSGRASGAVSEKEVDLSEQELNILKKFGVSNDEISKKFGS